MESENIEVEICGYEVIGQDPTSSDNHIYEIKIWIAQNFYLIKRSCTNFLELDQNLKKKYPKSNLPDCPFSTSSSSSNYTSSSSSSLTSSSNSSNNPSSTSSSLHLPSSASLLKHARNRHSLTRTITQQDNLGNKKSQLGKYFTDLLEIPEILRSVDLLNFLDIESLNGFDIPQETMSIIDSLLSKEKEITVTVLREYNLRVAVNENQFIIWRFSTKNKDIGFDISMEVGATGTPTTTHLLPYQRYKSHESAIEDVLEIQWSGSILLHWDNTYSKMLTKHLTYTFRVVDADIYQATTQKCLEMSRYKLECESKRNTLRRILTAKSMSLLASSGIRASMSAASVFEYKSSISNAGSGANHILYEEMQNEIEQLKIDKNSLQIALSTAELTISNLKEKEEEYQAEISRRDELLAQYEGGQTAVQRSGLVAELEVAQDRTRELEEKVEELKAENSKYRDIIEDCTRQTRRDSVTQLSLHQQQTTLQNELRQTQLELEGLKSSIAVTEAQLQRLKAEKKQLKAYAIQLKEKSEPFEINSNLWEKNKATLTNLISEIRPLHLELSEQIEIISSLKLRYIQLLTSLGQPVSQAMVESTDSSLFTATNSMETAAMLCDCAEMKGFVTSTAPKSSMSSGIVASSTTAALMQGVASPPPIKIVIKSDELQEIETASKEEYDDRGSESDASEESPILKSVKSSLWEIGSTMLEVEESIDKLLR